MKAIALFSICILGLLLIVPGSAFLSGYGYYQDGTISNSGGELTSYQIMYVVYTGAGSSSGNTIYLKSHSEADLDDLRFTDTSDNLYSYWIEPGSSPYNVWVEVPTIPNGDSTIRIQYGKADASAVSDGVATFIFFDHFDGDLSKWAGDTASASIGSSIVTVVGPGTPGVKCIYGTTASGSTSFAMRMYGYVTSGTTYEAAGAATPTRSHEAYIYNDNGAAKVASKDGSTESTSASNWAMNAWKTWDILVTGNTNSKYYQNGVELTGSPKTSNPPNSNDMRISLLAYTSSDQVRCDWVLLRKYTASEPSNTAWEDETVPATPTPTPTPTPTATTTPIPAGSVGVYEYGSNYIIWAIGANQTQVTIDGVLTNVTNSTSNVLYGQYDLQSGSTHVGCPLNGTCVVVNLHDDGLSILLMWGAYLMLVFLAIVSFKFPISAIPALVYGLWLFGVYLPDIGASSYEYIMVVCLISMSLIMAAIGMKKI